MRIDDMPLEEVLRLRTTEPEKLSDEDLCVVLRDRYEPESVPACRVCGGELSVASCGGGQATVYACSEWEDDPAKPGELRRKADRGVADDHYIRSRWTAYRGGDEHVLELLRRFGAV